MNNLKINIIYEIQEGPWGGGNQFLRALRNKFEQKGLYEKDPYKANCFLINSHHSFEILLPIKKKNQDKIFIHRIDGPLALTRKTIQKEGLRIDKEIYKLNSLIADGTIFQSNWSKKWNYSLGFKKTSFVTIIMNASDNLIFYPKKEKGYSPNKESKCKLVAASWTDNINKGFDLYKYLDENLDFNKYSMVFIGKSPIKFRNIKHIKPLDSNNLANVFRSSNIYITGSKNDPCSNSLIEALTCVLPCVVFNDGGHPEILKQGGEIFNSFEECIKKIDLIKDNYNYYRNNISVETIEEVTNKYLEFFKHIYSLQLNNKYKTKRLRTFDYYKTLFSIRMLKIVILKVIYRELIRIIKELKNKLIS